MNFSFGTPSASSSLGFSTSTSPSGASLFNFSAAPSTPSTTSSLFSTPSTTTPSTGFAFNTGPTLWPTTTPATPASADLLNIKPTNITPKQAIQGISASWGKDSQFCRFTHFFYNLVNPADVPKFVKPPIVNDKLWIQAVKDNPDSTRLVPLQIRGFAELRQRVEQQDKAVQDQQKALKEIQTFITGIQHKHELTTASKIQDYKRRHMQLAARVLRIMRRIEVMRSLGYPISMEEEAFRKKLENLYMELNKPTQFKGRLNELTSLVRMQDEVTQANYEPLDPESMQQLYKYLHQQQEGLKHLTDIVKGDLKDLRTMVSFFEEDINKAK